MENWVLWFLVAGIVVILEIFTGTFYLLMVAIGLAAGGLIALAGIGLPTQYITAGAVGVVATYVLRKTKFGKIEKGDASRDPNVNLDIGQEIDVPDWKTSAERSVSRVMYRGAMWDVELEHGAVAKPGAFIIRELRGSRLIVQDAAKNN